MKTVVEDKLDSAIYTWFIQHRSKGESISGPILSEKAILMNEKLGEILNSKHLKMDCKNLNLGMGFDNLKWFKTLPQ